MQTGRSLSLSKNVWLLLASRFVSQLGDKLFLPAILWLSLSSDSGSVARLGSVAFIIAIPPLVSAPIGVFVDRADPKRVMVASDLIRFVLCLILAANQMFWHRFELMAGIIFLIELVGPFFTLSSGTLIPKLVAETQLLTLNSYLNGIENLTSILGFAIGGFVIAWLGTESLILSNGISFFVSGLLILQLAVSRPKPEPNAPQETPLRTQESVWSEFVIGLKLTLSNRLIGNLLLTFFVLNIATASLEMLVTLWANQVLHIGASGYGLLLTSILGGSLLGNVVLGAPAIAKLNISSQNTISTLLMGLCLALFSFSNFLPSSIALMFLIGFFFSIVGVSFSTLVMKTAEQRHLGKVFGIIQTVIRGGHPVGVSLVTALLVSVDPRSIVLVIGSVVFVGGVYLLVVFAKQKKEPRSDR